jgi:hypothetical protein
MQEKIDVGGKTKVSFSFLFESIYDELIYSVNIGIFFDLGKKTRRFSDYSIF